MTTKQEDHFSSISTIALARATWPSLSVPAKQSLTKCIIRGTLSWGQTIGKCRRDPNIQLTSKGQSQKVPCPIILFAPGTTRAMNMIVQKLNFTHDLAVPSSWPSRTRRPLLNYWAGADLAAFLVEAVTSMVPVASAVADLWYVRNR